MIARVLFISVVAMGLCACSHDTWHTRVETSALGGYDLDPYGALRGYRIGPGDQVRVTVFREGNLSGDFNVDVAGTVGVPALGNVSIGGLTAKQAEQKLAALLGRDYVNDARVSVEVLKYRPFYIQGEVRRAGAYPFVPGITLRDAIATAGGFTYRASQREVYVQRAGSDIEDTYVYTYDGRIWVYPGDSIRIGERFF